MHLTYELANTSLLKPFHLVYNLICLYYLNFDLSYQKVYILIFSHKELGPSSAEIVCDC